MSLMTEIKAAQVAARIERNQLATSALTTLLGEAIVIGKNADNRETSDDEVIRLTKKFIDNVEFTMSKTSDPTLLTTLAQEREIYRKFMPAPLTTHELTGIIETRSGTTGQIMGYLKANYAGRYDGKVAAELVKNKLNRPS